MQEKRTERIKEIIRSGDSELMEARARVYPLEYAAALEAIKKENGDDQVSNIAEVQE